MSKKELVAILNNLYEQYIDNEKEYNKYNLTKQATDARSKAMAIMEVIEIVEEI